MKRQQEHLTQCDRGKQKRFHAALRVHGPEKFSWKLLVDGVIDQEEANCLERKWIVDLNAHVSCGGYNLTWGGHGTYGFKHNESSRKKIGDRFRGIPKTEEQRRKMGEAISRARKGKKYGLRNFKDQTQARQNMSLGQSLRVREKGWNHSDETRSLMKHPHKTYTCSLCGEQGHSCRKHTGE